MRALLCACFPAIIEYLIVLYKCLAVLLVFNRLGYVSPFFKIGGVLIPYPPPMHLKVMKLANITYTIILL